MERRLYTVGEAAQSLHLHAWSVRDLIRQGSIRATRLGRAVRISAEELDRIAREGTPSIERKRRRGA